MWTEKVVARSVERGDIDINDIPQKMRADVIKEKDIIVEKERERKERPSKASKGIKIKAKKEKAKGQAYGESKY